MNIAESSYASAGVLGPNDAVVLAGYVRGGDGRDWFDKDFAAIKLDRDGNLVWSWQVRECVVLASGRMERPVFCPPHSLP